MKKFVIAFAVLFVIIIGCKKLDEDNGGGICACSPVQTAYLSLVIKNANGDDLLNTATAGSFAQNQIQFYVKDANGVIKEINFSIRAPLTFNNEKLNYHQFVSQEIATMAKSVENKFYLKLGSGEPLLVNLQVSSNLSKVDKLLIDSKEVPKDNGKLTTDLGITIFTLTI